MGWKRFAKGCLTNRRYMILRNCSKCSAIRLGCLQVRDLCVGEIAQVLDMSISAVSHQLRVLRGAKLVKRTKEGKEVKYSLDDDHVIGIMEYGLTHINEDRQ